MNKHLPVLIALLTFGSFGVVGDDSSYYERITPKELKIKDNIERTILDYSTSEELGMNNGEDAGQTIFHCHVHLIPRRKGDIKNPRGGVRGVIPSKNDY